MFRNDRPCRFPSFTLAALLAVVTVTVTAADAPQRDALQPVAGIVAPNTLALSPLLVTAGQPTRDSLLRLRAEGYDAVISFAPGNTPDAVSDQAAILAAQGVQFVHIPIPWATPEAKHLDAMADAMRGLAGKKVLVHCQMNMRASAMTFLYRTVHAKEDPATAWADVKKIWTPAEQWKAYVDTQLQVAGIPFKAE
jgi:protein tyrosine phosphatase (PTP) superfamily phosphohydrolase (DUF442 family)